MNIRDTLIFLAPIAYTINSAVLIFAVNVIWKGGRILGQVIQTQNDHNQRLERLESVQDAKLKTRAGR